MLIQDVMTKSVVAIEPDMPIADAIKLMEQHNIRHFPIIEQHVLVGIVSDRDIGRVGSAHSEASAGITLQDEVRSIMVSPVLSAHPLDPVEESAKVLRQHKIGALPVLDGEALVGIVTAIDLLEALIKMTGVYDGTTRLEVDVPNQPALLAKLLAVIAERNIHVASVMTTHSDAEGVTFMLRVGTIDGRGLASDLTAEGFNVLWPLEKPGLRRQARVR